MKIAVTGAHGLLGSHLSQHLEARGYSVVRLCRGAAASGEMCFDLDRPPQPDALADFDALVHCAYDFEALGWPAVKRANVDGSIALLRAAAQARVTRLLFISTISAFAGCKSHYGQGKMMVEEAVRGLQGVSIRPGLIYGDAQGRGIFGTLERASRLPLLPVFSGGEQPLYPVHIEDLVVFIDRVLENFDALRGRVLYAASSEPITFRRLLLRLSHAHGRRLRLMSIPSPVALLGLRVAETIGLRIGLRSDSLISLINFDPVPAIAQNSLGMEFRRFDAAPS